MANNTTIDIERVECSPPLTPAQIQVARLMQEGWKFRKIGAHMGITESTVKWHVEEAAKRIPGDLPPRLRMLVWYRGAPRYVLGLSPADRLRNAMKP